MIFEKWLDRNTNFAFMEKRRLWYSLLRELIERRITKAQKIIKKEIILHLKEDNFEEYRYLLDNGFFKLLNLEGLEDVYDLIPKKDMVALRHTETLILKATIRKRRNLKEER